MCLLAGTGQSPIYNEPLTAWSRAHARWGLDCCSPRQGGPLPSKHCTAQGLTTTTAAGTDTGNTASVITTQTLLNTVSIVRNPSDQPALFVPPFLCVRSLEGGSGCFIPTQGGYFPCTDSPEVFREACRGGRWWSSSSSQRCGFFFFLYPKGTQQTATFIVLSSGLKCQGPPPPPPPPICPRYTPGFASWILLQSLPELFSQAWHIFFFFLGENRSAFSCALLDTTMYYDIKTHCRMRAWRSWACVDPSQQTRYCLLFAL